MKNIILISFFGLVFGCKPDSNGVIFYVVNNSRVDASVMINLSIDADTIINQAFLYSGQAPDYKTFEKIYNKGTYSIIVEANGMRKSDTLHVVGKRYVYISYDAAIMESGDTSRGLSIYKTAENFVHY